METAAGYFIGGARAFGERNETAVSREVVSIKVSRIDALVSRRIKLALLTEFPDYEWLANEWNKLEADFSAEGMIYNAELCYSNWRRYSQIALDLQAKTDIVLFKMRYPYGSLFDGG